MRLATDLAGHCDVLIENYRAGVMQRLGLGPADLLARYPRLVYASITGYGATGPWAHRRAYAPVVGAESGLTKAQGDARGAVYANDPASHADVYTALEVTTALLAALYQRERNGRGQWIDVSMAETMLYVNEHLHDQLWDRDVNAGIIRSFSPADYLVFEVADGNAVVVSGHPAERGTFELFLRALSLEHLADDPRFADVAARQANFDDLRAALLDAGRSIPDAATFEEQFGAHQLAVGVLRTARELAETDWAQRAGGDHRGVRSWRRHDPHPQPAVAVQRRRSRCARRGALPRGGQPGRPRRAARLRRRDHRRLGGGRGPLQPFAIIAAVTLSFPVAPMKASLGTLPGEDTGWAYEVKWDGYRTLAFVEGGRVRLQSSNLIDVTAKYPEMQELAGAIGVRRAVLDGELVVLDDAGRPRFELIQRHALDKREAAFYAFDVLSIDDHDTISLPYEDRRRLLDGLLEEGPNWAVPAHRVGDGQALVDLTDAQELEGVMAKRLGTTYRPGTRTKEWRKVKHRRRAEVVIGGYTPGAGLRTGSFGALLVGRWVDDHLAFAGGVGTGFTQRRLDELGRRFAELEVAECPFDPPPPTAYRRGATWLDPVLRATVELTEFTNEGYVRQASFIELVE